MALRTNHAGRRLNLRQTFQNRRNSEQIRTNYLSNTSRRVITWISMLLYTYDVASKGRMILARLHDRIMSFETAELKVRFSMSVLAVATFTSGRFIQCVSPTADVMWTEKKISCLYRECNSGDPTCKVTYWTPIPEVHKFLKKFSSHLKIQGARRVTWSRHILRTHEVTTCKIS